MYNKCFNKAGQPPHGWWRVHVHVLYRKERLKGLMGNPKLLLTLKFIPHATVSVIMQGTDDTCSGTHPAMSLMI